MMKCGVGVQHQGAIGDNSTTHRTTAVKITGIWRTVSSTQSNWGINGGGARCGIKDDGLLYCWGYNVDAQLGDGTTTQRNVPTAVVGDLSLRMCMWAQDTLAAPPWKGWVFAGVRILTPNSETAPPHSVLLLSPSIIAKSGRTFLAWLPIHLWYHP